MVPLTAVYGDWEMEDSSWNFVVDGSKGGRVFFLSERSTHGELVQMAKEEYNIETAVVELSYVLPEALLQQMGHDTPPVYITTDRQVHGLIELSRVHMIRLCVSSRYEMDVENEVEDSVGDINFDEDDAEDAEEYTSVVKDEDENENDEDEDDEDENENDDDDVVQERGATDDEDYSNYGKVKDEDENENDDNVVLERGATETSLTTCFGVGKSYSCKEELQNELRLLAVMRQFTPRTYKSTTTLFVAKCSIDGCRWKLRAAVKNELNRFWVTKFVDIHTCSVVDRIAHHRASTPKFIAHIFISRIGIINGITPTHIKDSLRTIFGMRMSYMTSYRALLYAQQLVRGNAEDGYHNLPSYLIGLQKANPGTVIGLEIDEEHKFKYLFLAFGASIAGFQYMRRVIVVDGTHLTGKYGGVLLVATAQDGNFQLFPLAFGIVDSENDASWEWFFTKLRECVSDQKPLVIISDRNSSIKNAIEKVLPWALRGICYYHLQNNIVTNFKGRQLMYYVKGAAYAHTLHEFNRYMDDLRRLRPDIAAYLETADVSLWSRVHFQGDRYNIKTSNIAESLNSALKVAKGFPLTFLLEFIREKLGRWFWKRREDAMSLTTPHTRGVEYLLAVREDYARKMTVERIDGWRFHVKGTNKSYLVDLENRMCECGVWNIEKVPCSHVIATAIEVGVHVSSFVCPSYSKEYLYAGYSQSIFPKMDDDTSVQCLPPFVKSLPGRKKKSRWQSWLELSRKKEAKPRKIHRKYTCTICNMPGHTRVSCVSVVV